MKREYGLQLYSVRDAAKESMDNALKEVAAMGYSFVEFAGFFDHSAEEIKAVNEELDQINKEIEELENVLGKENVVLK